MFGDKKTINYDTNILSLNTVFDDKKIMRISGRPKNVEISENCNFITPK